jgi:hypothetical protein
VCLQIAGGAAAAATGASGGAACGRGLWRRRRRLAAGPGGRPQRAGRGRGCGGLGRRRADLSGRGASRYKVELPGTIAIPV